MSSHSDALMHRLQQNNPVGRARRNVARHYDPGEIEREPAPAGTDVQNLLPRFEQQLGREVALLVVLRGLQAVIVAGEVGAGVLAVRIQEQIVERVRQVVMMGDVALGPSDRVELLDPARLVVEDRSASFRLRQPS